VAATELERAFAEPPGAARLVDIAFAVSHLQTSADDAQGSLASSIKGNADGLTARTLSGPRRRSRRPRTRPSPRVSLRFPDRVRRSAKDD